MFADEFGYNGESRIFVAFQCKNDFIIAIVQVEKRLQIVFKIFSDTFAGEYYATSRGIGIVKTFSENVIVPKPLIENGECGNEKISSNDGDR
jgi:hypothetical protein